MDWVSDTDVKLGPLNWVYVAIIIEHLYPKTFELSRGSLETFMIEKVWEGVWLWCEDY